MSLSKRRIWAIVLGGVLWVLATGTLLNMLRTVQQRAARPITSLTVQIDGAVPLQTGDGVFVQTQFGLMRGGEVADVDAVERRVTLHLDRSATEMLNSSTRAVCWKAPLSVEDAIPALLPPAVQDRMAAQIQLDWKEHRDEIDEAWGPLVSELAGAYLEAIGPDVQAAFERHEDQLWRIARKHGRATAAAWPRLQERLAPILQEYLTPVLGRLMNDAISDAPKVRIAWAIARGRNAEAFQQMMDWQAEYFATMSEADKAELQRAVRYTWEKATADPVLSAEFSRLGRNLLSDAELRAALSTIYHEAFVENPRSEDFFREKVLGSPRVQARLYRLVEVFGPTARRVLEIALFDQTGRTRSEVVHFLRSVILDRRVAWVTLEPGKHDQDPLSPNLVLQANVRGAVH